MKNFILLILFCSATLFIDYASAQTSSRRRQQGSSKAKTKTATTPNAAKKNIRSATGSSGAARKNIRSATGSSGAAAPRKNIRSATGSSSTQQRNNVRQATNNNRSRVMSAGTRKTPATAASNSSSSTNTSSSANSSLCPIGQTIKQEEEMVKTTIEGETTEETKMVYYKSKTAKCTAPENATPIIWKDSPVKDLYPRPTSWVAENKAIIFLCDNTFSQVIKEKITACVPNEIICKLNTFVKKEAENKFLFSFQSENDTTGPSGEECQIPMNAVMANKTGDKNMASYHIADEESFNVECITNYYSDKASNTCKQCPIGMFAAQGSKGPLSCIPACPTNQMVVQNGNTNECRTCDINATYIIKTKSCQCKLGYETITPNTTDDNVGYQGNCRLKVVATDCAPNATYDTNALNCVCNDGYKGDGRIKGSQCSAMCNPGQFIKD